MTDAAAARDRLREHYEAICGGQVLAASLTAPRPVGATVARPRRAVIGL
ncbi:MAG: hypothetical protein WKF73_03735 [Nocardioidaceae bacterium]